MVLLKENKKIVRYPSECIWAKTDRSTMETVDKQATFNLYGAYKYMLAGF